MCRSKGLVPGLLIQLFVEGLVEGGELIVSQDATLPPGLQEADAITEKLYECGKDRQGSDLETLVVPCRINEYEKGVDDQREEWHDCNKVGRVHLPT